jgi:hypothetical protein
MGIISKSIHRGRKIKWELHGCDPHRLEFFAEGGRVMREKHLLG